MVRAYQDQTHFPSIPATGPPPETILARTTIVTLTDELLEDREPYCSDDPERLGRAIPGGPIDVTVTFDWKGGSLCDPGERDRDEEQPLEPLPKDGKDLVAEARRLRHLLTHTPKNPWCAACQKAKMQRKPCPGRPWELNPLDSATSLPPTT